ncbi:hypothetical protein EIP91_001284 [Steccherinum ochraceum]|uniref:Uncharacterized protein n=1 Tax=Steccherinum ochraceum TaxID=92696 RepID=A0A4R0RRP3_9APHY|nr:hypothetical protein EIP91_001284 [Steccherinum ochraceum]
MKRSTRSTSLPVDKGDSISKRQEEQEKLMEYAFLHVLDYIIATSVPKLQAQGYEVEDPHEMLFKCSHSGYYALPGFGTATQKIRWRKRVGDTLPEFKSERRKVQQQVMLDLFDGEDTDEGWWHWPETARGRAHSTGCDGKPSKLFEKNAGRVHEWLVGMDDKKYGAVGLRSMQYLYTVFCVFKNLPVPRFSKVKFP